MKKMPVRTEGHTGPAGQKLHDASSVPFNIPGPSVQATLDWSMLVQSSLNLLVLLTLDLPVLLSQDSPVHTSQC